MDEVSLSVEWFDKRRKLVVDFDQLATLDSEWSSFYENGTIDWSDPRTNQYIHKKALNSIPNRWDYIAWMQRLIDTTGLDYSDERNESDHVLGVDIGTGSSCIYPLLGCRNRREWHFVGTEVDTESFQNASANLKRNNLDGRVTLIQQSAEDPLIPRLVRSSRQQHGRQASFTMCNPPFYASEDEMQSLQSKKAAAPSAVNTGAAIEMITKGGERAFILGHLEQSVDLGCAVQWYTTLAGRLSTMKEIIDELKAAKVTNWIGTPIQAGHKTRRWIIAWSFDNFRPPMSIIRLDDGDNAEGQISSSTETSIGDLAQSDEEVMAQLLSLLQSLELEIRHRKSRSVVCIVYSNVWGRGARRKRKRGEEVGQGAADSEPTMVAKMTKTEKEGSVVVRWMRGVDRGIFDSFCAYMKNNLRERCPGSRKGTSKK